MNSTNLINALQGDVCSWELRINEGEFRKKHFLANPGDNQTVFFNITFIEASNIIFYVMLGNSIKNVTNVV